MDAFALDISGAWTANVPRERGEMVLFNLNIHGADLSALSGVGSQHYDNDSWDFKVCDGSLVADAIKIKLEFGVNGTFTHTAISRHKTWITLRACGGCRYGGVGRDAGG